MTLPTSNQSALDVSIRAVVGTFLGIVIGISNRVIITGVLRHTVVAQLVGFGIGGLIAGAIQGLFMRHYTRSTLVWIMVSGLGWMIIGLPELWFPDNTFSLWLCDYLARRALVGLVSGGMVGILQALTLRPRAQTIHWWLIGTGSSGLAGVDKLVIPHQVEQKSSSHFSGESRTNLFLGMAL